MCLVIYDYLSEIYTLLERCTVASYYCFITKKTLNLYLDPASCKEVKESGLSNGDGEYDLYLLHPVCLKTSRVYCADINTDNPLEYVTLPAGRDTNYALDNRLPWGEYQWEHGKTAYDKVGNGISFSSK